MEQSVESNSFGFEKFFRSFFKIKYFSKNPVKPGYGNLVLITATNCSSSAFKVELQL